MLRLLIVAFLVFSGGTGGFISDNSRFDLMSEVEGNFTLQMCDTFERPRLACHPTGRCIDVEGLLFYRTRMARLLMHYNLSWMAPRFNFPLFEEMAKLELFGNKSLVPVACNDEYLDLTLAMICEGLLGGERLLRGLANSDNENLMATAAKLLTVVLRCPWSKLSGNGWPVFALLARIARIVARQTLSPAPRSRCPGGSQWNELARQSYRAGLTFRFPDGMSIFDIAIFETYPPIDTSLDSSCLWDAADDASLPSGLVCVTVPPPGSIRPLFVARDCNPFWPKCEQHQLRGRNGRSAVHYWLDLPRTRELTADHIREEQRPYCILNHQDNVLLEIHWLLHKLATLSRQFHRYKQPFVLVEVGSNFGDCIFLAHAVTQHVKWPLNATGYEPGKEAVSVFRRSVTANRAEGRIHVREAAVGDGSTPVVQFLVPFDSSVHASVMGGLLANAVGENGNAHVVNQVASTSLDAEFPTQTIHLLLIGVAGGDLDVLQGAHLLLKEQRVQSIITLSWTLQRLTGILHSYGYNICKTINWTPNSWVLARIRC